MRSLVRRLAASRTTRVAAVALAAGAALAVPGVASAQPLNNVAVTTGASGEFLVLDVSGASTSPGAQLIQWYGNGGSNQRFTFQQQRDGNTTIVNQNSGMCLTTSGYAGDAIYQW